jgi:glycosyltransferase involved in cell wall biosynthesis
MKSGTVTTVPVGIFAHREERRIAACLASLPLDDDRFAFHVLVNGSDDRTADIARGVTAGHANVTVHDLHPGGKSRTWNRFVRDLVPGSHDAWIFLDGDAEILPGSLPALLAALAENPNANAAAGMPRNGRRAETYRQMLRTQGGLFGDLYALSGSLVDAIRARALWLPEDLIGDDGLLAAFAATDLGTDADWDSRRILACETAGFLCEPIRLASPASWRLQYRRMLSYSVRHLQNRIISDIMQREGPGGLPDRLATLYPGWLPRFRPRAGLSYWFDRQALRRMRAALTPR